MKRCSHNESRTFKFQSWKKKYGAWKKQLDEVRNGSRDRIVVKKV